MRAESQGARRNPRHSIRAGPVHGGLQVAVAAISVLWGVSSACDRRPAEGIVPVAISTTPAVAAPVPPAVPPSPVATAPPTRARELGVVAALGDEGWITLVRAEAAPAGRVRLQIAVQLSRPGWASDAAPSAAQNIYLTDERGRRIPLESVSGSTASDNSTLLSLDGWYTFGPLAPGPRLVRLTYPVYDDGTDPVEIAIALGDAAPPLTAAQLVGIWRTAHVSAPAAYAGSGSRPSSAWPFDRIEFLPDGGVILRRAGESRATAASFESVNGTRLAFTPAGSAALDFIVDEFTPERLVLTRLGSAGTEWVVLTRQ